ncbi:MAG TPA: hypothetical protein VI032_06440 [Burkholderiaceae bacterium]
MGDVHDLAHPASALVDLDLGLDVGAVRTARIDLALAAAHRQRQAAGVIAPLGDATQAFARQPPLQHRPAGFVELGLHLRRRAVAHFAPAQRLLGLAGNRQLLGLPHAKADLAPVLAQAPSAHDGRAVVVDGSQRARVADLRDTQRLRLARADLQRPAERVEGD